MNNVTRSPTQSRSSACHYHPTTESSLPSQRLLYVLEDTYPQHLAYNSQDLTITTSPQSNLRRAHCKGPIGSDIIRFKIDPRPASRYCVFWRRMLSRGHDNGIIRCRLAAGTAAIAILCVHFSSTPTSILNLTTVMDNAVGCYAYGNMFCWL